MLRLLSVLVIATQALGEILLLNEVIDQALNRLDASIRQAGKDVIQIPEIKRDWKYRWHFVKLSGHMNYWDGYAKSLASLKRTGDVVMTTEGNQITLKVTLGLGTLDVGFNRCQFNAMGLFSVTQQISASVSSNSIEAQVTHFKNGDQCIMRLDSIGVTTLGTIKVNPGRGVLHKIEGKITNWFVRYMHSSVAEAINSALQKEALRSFAKTDLCNKIPH